eukprot:SAG11_NODE_550_length_8588_cov_9.354105_2_plen_30_part_00
MAVCDASVSCMLEAFDCIDNPALVGAYDT